MNCTEEAKSQAWYGEGNGLFALIDLEIPLFCVPLCLCFCLFRNKGQKAKDALCRENESRSL